MKRMMTYDGILEELEEIRTKVEKKQMGESEAKIRMWGTKNAIRIHALKYSREQLAFQKEVFAKAVEASQNRPKQSLLPHVSKGVRSSRQD